MKTISTKAVVFASPEIEAVGKAFEEVTASFERFCLAAGIEALSAMMTKDAEEACGPRHCRSTSRHAWLWLRYQPDSDLSVWFRTRVGSTKGRIRRIAIVALAHKLLVALWRYLETGVVPRGAVLKG